MRRIELIDRGIEQNKELLLACFGYQGITRSNSKVAIIESILDEFEGEYEQLVSDFFDELEEYYLRDSVFQLFTVEEIVKMIVEERTYMIIRHKGK